MMDHSQTEDEATISSILGTVFSVEKEKQALQRKVVKQRVPPREQNIFL